MKATHRALGISLAKVDEGWALDIAAKGPQRLLIALDDSQLRGLAHLIEATLPRPLDQSADH